MFTFILQTLAACTFLITWILLSLASASLIWRNKNKKGGILLVLPLVIICWGVVSYNTWYEGFFLVQKMSLFPTLHSWALTVFAPLFYLYGRFRVIGQFPEKSQLGLHLFLPALLACIYISMVFISPVADSLTYSWTEFSSAFPAWWTLFRISCILVAIIQVSFYFRNLRRTNEFKEAFPQIARTIQKRRVFLVCTSLIFLLNILACSYVCNIIFSLYVAFLSGTIFYHSLMHQMIKRKLKPAIYASPNSDIAIPDENEHLKDDLKEEKELEENAVSQDTETKTTLQLAPTIINQINRQLHTPEFLFNEKITLKQLSQIVGINCTYLSRYFKQEHGCSFPKYISLLRLEKAETLLKESGISMEDICYQTGFESPSTFYKVFKERYGCTPAEWKKKYMMENKA